MGESSDIVGSFTGKGRWGRTDGGVGEGGGGDRGRVGGAWFYGEVLFMMTTSLGDRTSYLLFLESGGPPGPR